MGVYTWMACRVFSLTAVLIYIVVIRIFLYYVSLYSKNIVTIRFKFVFLGALPSLKDKRDMAGQRVMQFATSSCQLMSTGSSLPCTGPARNLGNGLQGGFKTPTSPLNLQVKGKQWPLCGTEEGETQAHSSLFQEELEAAGSARVHAHTTGSSPKTASPGACVHALQLIALCSSDCKNKDQLITLHLAKQVSTSTLILHIGKTTLQAVAERAGASARTGGKGIRALWCASCRPASLRQQNASPEESELRQLLWTGAGSSRPVLMSMDCLGQPDPALCQEYVVLLNFWLLVTCSLLRETGVSRTACGSSRGFWLLLQ